MNKSQRIITILIILLVLTCIVIVGQEIKKATTTISLKITTNKCETYTHSCRQIFVKNESLSNGNIVKLDCEKKRGEECREVEVDYLPVGDVNLTSEQLNIKWLEEHAECITPKSSVMPTFCRKFKKNNFFIEVVKNGK